MTGTGPGLEPREEAHDGGSHHRPFVAVLVAGGVVVVALIVVLVVLAAGNGGRDARTYRYVIPAGTGARIDAGEKVDLVPSRLVTHVGDRLVLRNDDDRAHHMGPLVVDAHGVLRMRFARAGTIEGVCTLNEAETAKIVIRD
jgi:hypothetical protein